MTKKRADVVSASEIAAWEWCPESWRLETLGQEAGNKDELAHGKTFHDDTTTIEVSSRQTLALGWRLLVCGLFAAALVLVLKVVGR